MTGMILTYRGAVYPWHCDHMGHMNVMWYVSKFDEGTWNLLNLVGFTRDYMREHKAASAGVEQNITYKRELVAGDSISVYSTVLEVRDRAVRFRHEMRENSSGDVTAVMEIAAVHMDAVSRRATPFPTTIREKLLKLRDGAAQSVDGCTLNNFALT